MKIIGNLLIIERKGKISKNDCFNTKYKEKGLSWLQNKVKNVDSVDAVDHITVNADTNA